MKKKNLFVGLEMVVNAKDDYIYPLLLLIFLIIQELCNYILCKKLISINYI